MKTLVSPGFMLPPSFYLKSSDDRIVKISGGFGRVAWAEAVAPGRAEILDSHRPGRVTPIRVGPASD